MTRTILLLITFLVIFASCSTDFEVNAPWKDEAIIYGLIDQTRDTNYIKINKAFLGEADAYDMASEIDSITYSTLDVTIERYIDDELRDTYVLTRTNEIQKDTGIFANDDNYLYILTDQLVTGQWVGSQWVPSIFKLVIEKPNANQVVSAETELIKSFNLGRWSSARTIGLSGGTYDIVWLATYYAKIYYVTICINYNDITGEDTTLQTLRYPLSVSVSKSTDNDGQLPSESEELTKRINGEEFYKFIASSLESIPNTRRMFVSLDFEFDLGSEDFYTYQQVNKPSSGLSQTKPVFTNVVNGKGLFTSSYKQVLLDKILDDKSIDSLSDGQFTKTLGFADHNGAYND